MHQQPCSDSRAVVLSGMLALATAMGIGRFAFTPLLPMMLHDGVISLQGASWLASANYIGYLVGALLCMFKPVAQTTRMVRVGLAGTGLLTLGMALPWAQAWPWLRFAAGVASAVVFVYTSGWCLSQAALRGNSSMGALIYTGPGAGIVLTGLAASAMVATAWRSEWGWLVFGILALGLTALVWPVFHPRNTLTTDAALRTEQTGTMADHGRLEVGLFALAYGLAGFGYIVTATFLPVMARQAIPGSAWLDMFWPIFGCGVMVGALLASRIKRTGDLRLWLLACYLMQAAGVVLSLVFPHVLGFALGSLLVGLPFTAITYFAMQETRRIRAQRVASTIGLLTALYGLGQIIGPPLAAYLVGRSSSTGAGFDLAVLIAAALLLLGACLFAALVRWFPVRR